MRTIIILFAVALVLSPLTAFADDISGTYKAKGKNSSHGKYKGEVSIKKKAEVYELTWKIGDQEFIGIGILENGVLSVGYTDSNKNWFGVMSYQVKGKELHGKWAVYGASRVGTEVLTPKK